MCYEERYFFEWTRKALQKRDEVKSHQERIEPGLQPERTAPKPAQPRELERELETV